MKISDKYLAGFLDGEGCISIHRHKKIRDKYKQCDLRVEIVNCYLLVIREIAKRLKTKFIRKTRQNPNWKILYRISIPGNKAMQILKRLLPYLIVKRKQAKLAIDFQKMKNQKNWKRMNRDKYNKLKKSYWIKFKKLNKRGIEK